MKNGTNVVFYFHISSYLLFQSKNHLHVFSMLDTPNVFMISETFSFTVCSVNEAISLLLDEGRDDDEFVAVFGQDFCDVLTDDEFMLFVSPQDFRLDFNHEIKASSAFCKLDLIQRRAKLVINTRTNYFTLNNIH